MLSYNEDTWHSDLILNRIRIKNIEMEDFMEQITAMECHGGSSIHIKNNVEKCDKTLEKNTDNPTHPTANLVAL